MKRTARLFQCALCHTQSIVCSCCDRGQIYCGIFCVITARKKAMKLAGVCYQNTFNGKQKHAARQSCYRERQKKIVTHQGSPSIPQNVPINPLENKANKTETGQKPLALTCGFCGKPVSAWVRNDFVRRRGAHTSFRSKVFPQAP